MSAVDAGVGNDAKARPVGSRNRDAVGLPLDRVGRRAVQAYSKGCRLTNRRGLVLGLLDDIDRSQVLEDRIVVPADRD